MRYAQCDEEATNKDAFTDKFREWHKSVTSSPLLGDIAKRKRTASAFTDAVLIVDSDYIDENSTNEAFLVHSKDMEAWRKALKVVNKYNAKSSPALTESLIDALRWSNPDQTLKLPEGEESKESEKGAMDRRVDVLGHIISSVSSLACSNHGLPLERVVFKADADPKDPCISLVSSFVEPLTPPEYEAFIGSLYNLGVLLASHSAQPNGTDCEEEFKLEKSLPHVTPGMLEKFKQTHPKVRFPLQVLVSNSSSLTSGEFDMEDILKRHYAKGICRNEECNKDFDEDNDVYMALEAAGQDKTVDVDLFSETIENADDSTDDFSLRVFQIAAKAESNTVISSILGLPSCSDKTAANATAFGGLRRSSRKRKTANTNGNVMREYSLRVQAHYNIATVRLHLYEKYSGFPLDRNLALIIPRSNSVNAAASDSNCIDMTLEELTTGSTSSPNYAAVGLPYAIEWNEKSLDDVVKESVPDVSLKGPLRSEIFLCWKDSDGTKKMSGDDTPIPNETLLDSLLEMSNASTATDETLAPGEKKKSTRRAERGFCGTLLHSSAPARSYEDKKSDAEGSMEQKKENQDSDSNTPTLEKENESDDYEKPKKVVAEAEAVIVLRESEEEMPVKNRNDESLSVVVTHTSTATTNGRSDHLKNRKDESLSVLVSHNSTATTNGRSHHLKNRKDESLSVLVSHTSTATSNGRSHHLRRSIHDPKEEAIIKTLMDNLSFGSIHFLKIQSRCRTAVPWAITSNPEHTSIEELTDVALAKFYEVCSDLRDLW